MVAIDRRRRRQFGETEWLRLARRLIGAGYHGLMVRSFAPGTTADDLNLGPWAWGAGPPARLTLIDDENRLS
jgi:hypothetical protein